MKVGLVYSDGDLYYQFPEDCKGRDDNKNMRDIRSALHSIGYDCTLLRADYTLIDELKKLKDRGEVSVIFNAADEGYNLNTHLEAHIPALLDILGFKYTGSGIRPITLCLDKRTTKQILLASGLPTPNFKLFEKPISEENADAELGQLSFPLIIKPAQEDGSIGIKRDSVVENKAALVSKVNEVIEKYEQPALVEEYIDGREVNIGVLGSKHIETLPPSEILFNLPPGEKNFLSYETKWEEGSVYYEGTVPNCPADLDPNLRAELEELTKKAYTLMGVQGYGRVDFRISKDGKPYILEVNPNPDISADAGLARMAAARGLTYAQLIDRIIKIALGEEHETDPKTS